MAQRFYEGQTLTLKGQTNDSDIDSASLKEIRTKNPNGIVSENTATITESTKLTITLSAASVIKGVWSCHTYAEFAGGIVKKGRTYMFEVHEVFT